MAEPTVGKSIPVKLLRKHKINKLHIKKLTVAQLKNLEKVVIENSKTTGEPGCGVCCTTP